MTTDTMEKEDGIVHPDVVPEHPVVASTPIDIRSVSLAILMILTVIFMAKWAKDILIPLVLSIFLSYTLDPAVAWLSSWKIPRALGSALVLILLVTALSGLTYSLREEGHAFIELLPTAAQKFRQAMQQSRSDGPGAIDRVQKAATELGKTAEEASAATPATPKGVTRVQIAPPAFNLSEVLWQGSKDLIGIATQTVMVLFLVYFLLASGDMFKRKLAKITGPTLAKKRVTVQILDQIHLQIQRYLMVQIVTSVIVGVVTWAAFYWVGLEQAGIWGLAAGILNIVPYLGLVIITVVTSIVGFIQFGTIPMALLIGSISLIIHSVEAFWLTPWMTSRTSRMNAVAVFIGILFWGWLWGMAGLLLGIPILMAIKAVCEHIEDLKPIGEVLSD